MTLSFKYKAITRPNGDIVRTPSIPITLSGNSQTKIEVIALIDSGADISIISQDIAELLSLDLSEQKDISRGIGGEVEVINTKMSVNIKKGYENYTLNIPVQVILGDSKIPIILGRAGFFDNFIISFNQRQERVFLKKIELSNVKSY